MDGSISRFNRVIYLINTRSQLYRKDQMPAAGRASPLRRSLFPRQRWRGCDSRWPVTIVSFEISSGRLVASHRYSPLAEWSPPARQNGTLPAAANRSRGIACQFFAFLAASRPFRAEALVLEVDPTNEHAKTLYESIGFERRPYSTLTYRLSTQ
jgi:hypothetical protein